MCFPNVDTGHGVSESQRLAKHKDWPTHAIYIHTMAAQLAPAVQSLQAPLFLSAASGRMLSTSSLAAQLSLIEGRLLAALADRNADRQINEATRECHLAVSLTEIIKTLIQSALSNPAQQLHTVTDRFELEPIVLGQNRSVATLTDRLPP